MKTITGKELRLNYRQMSEWPSTSKDALLIDAAKSREVDLITHNDAPKTIAAVEAIPGWGGEWLYAVAVLMTFPELELLHHTIADGQATFPYLRGLRYYREGRVVQKALSELSASPDIIIVGGHGIAHPRRCGLASHIGIDFDIPAFGCARRLLCGVHHPVAMEKGSSQTIVLGGQTVGVAYRSRTNVKPVYISPGHKCDLEFAQAIVLACLGKFRFPEPLGLAHRMVNRYRRQMDIERISDTPYGRDVQKRKK